MKILMILWICLISFLCFYGCFKNTEWFKKAILQKDCEYVLPNNYKMVKNSGTGEYAILLSNGEYLRCYFSNDDITGTNLPKYATTFEDSCKAKAFCKKYFKQLLKYKFE